MSMRAKNKIAGNRSFSELSDLVNKAGMRLKTQESTADLKPSKSRVPELAPPKAEPAGADEDVFLGAMDGVDRASWRHKPHPSPPPEPKPPKASDSIDHRLMQAAFDDDKPMPILDHPEYIEGWIGVAGMRFLPLLRNGLYSIQGQIDLHGYNRVEAQIVVEDYITQMARFQSCCIKIIHGRGINSPTDRATLKESLQRVLSTRRMSRYVVAYASAPGCDGGVGAVYVLLRRQ
jgi:DNA-nicking Smr family endonuclease